MKYLLIRVVLSLTLVSTGNVWAFEFFGATVSDMEVPSAYMRWGMIGSRPIVTSVLPNSPAELAGFGRGNIILSVNGTTVGSAADLGRFSADRLAVLVFSGDNQITLTLDRAAYEAEQAGLALESGGGVASSPPPPAASPVPQPDNAPAIVLDNATIEQVYGAATPEQRAVEAQRAEQIRLENERNLRLQQERVLQDRSIETEQMRQRQDAELRARDEQQRRSEEMRRDQEMRGMERGRR
jgi:hypothetical protein